MDSGIQYMRPAQVCKALGISRPCLYRWMKAKPDFPRSAKLSSRCTVFDAAEVAAFVKGRMEGSAPPAASAAGAARQ